MGVIFAARPPNLDLPPPFPYSIPQDAHPHCSVLYPSWIPTIRGMKGTLVLDTAEAVERVRAGDTGAYGEIVEAYQTAVIRYLYRLTGDYETAKDLAQDTFIQAYRALPKTTPDLTLRTWLYRIAINNALHHRRKKRTVSFVPLEDGPGSEIALESDIGSPVDAMAVQEALLRVPEKLRACMVLHYTDGFKYREITETLGISEDAVRMGVARGSDEFRKVYRVQV